MTDTDSNKPETTDGGDHHHVAVLQTIERQIGEHVLSALRDGPAVAALTTLVPGVRHDRVISLPLSKEQVEAIRDVLEQAESEAAEAENEDDSGDQREGFLGFHTVLDLEEPTDHDAGDKQS